MMVINNILSRKERKELLELCKPLVKYRPGYPAKQSDEFLHLNPSVRKYIEIFNKKISDRLSKQLYFQKVWVNEDRGYRKDVHWHNRLLIGSNEKIPYRSLNSRKMKFSYVKSMHHATASMNQPRHQIDDLDDQAQRPTTHLQDTLPV